MHGRYFLAVVVPLLAAGSAWAGPISVFSQVWDTAVSNNGEISVAGLGSWAVLSWNGLNNPVTVADGQTRGRQRVIGSWPVMGFRDPAQYDAERGTVVAVPETAVRLYVEVLNGEYGRPGSEFRQIYVPATVSARVSADVGQNAVDWQFPGPPVQVLFGDGTVVSIGYHAVRMPDGIPQIQFEDGSPSLGFPGPVYYPTILEAEVEVSRPPTDPGSGGLPGDGVPATPEPSSVVLLAGLALGGWAGRRVRACRAGTLPPVVRQT